MFIEPCCAHKQIPQAIKSSPANTLYYYTNGDVTFEKTYKAVAHLLDSPAVMVLTRPDLDVATLRYLDLCFSRGWVTDLILTTRHPSSDLVRIHLAEHLSHISCVEYNMITTSSSVFALIGEQKSLIINGEIPLIPVPTQTVNSLMLRPSKAFNITEFLSPIFSLHRIRIKQASATLASAAPVQPPVPVASAVPVPDVFASGSFSPKLTALLGL